MTLGVLPMTKKVGKQSMSRLFVVQMYGILKELDISLMNCLLIQPTQI